MTVCRKRDLCIDAEVDNGTDKCRCDMCVRSDVPSRPDRLWRYHVFELRSLNFEPERYSIPHPSTRHSISVCIVQRTTPSRWHEAKYVTSSPRQ